MSNASHSNVERPAPTDFDTFLPWACKEYGVDSDVVIHRDTQKTFVSLAASHPPQKLAKKLSHKSKAIKELSVVTSISTSGDVHNSLLDTSFTSTGNKITIDTVYNSDDCLVQLKFLQNKIIPRKVMQIIALTLPYQTYLTSITINSGLDAESLYEISKFLPNSQITELCFDGTFLSEANYNILLKKSRLKHLSLATCKLSDDVVKMIAEQLKDPSPAAKILSALNLSSNRITDVGAKYLADMLRTNRQLSYLNLAGNMITDEGSISIFDTLQKFPMQPSEVLEGRTRYVAYLKKKNAIIETLVKDLEATAYDLNANKKRVYKKHKLESQSLQNVGMRKPFTDTEAQIIQDRAEHLAESKLGLFNDPFSPANTKTYDGIVHCLGNNTLCCLNLAYNNLTYSSVKKLRDVLLAQQSLYRIPRGLVKVVIEGNLMPVACEEFGEIDGLLRSGLLSLTKHEAGVKKKASSARSTIKTIQSSK